MSRGRLISVRGGVLCVSTEYEWRVSSVQLLSVVLHVSSPHVIRYQFTFGLHLKSGIFGIIIIVTFRLAERIRGRENFYIQTIEIK